MEVSENFQVDNSRKESPDGSGKVEVEVEDGVDFGEVIELPPEPAAINNDGSAEPEWAVEVVQAAKESVDEENSRASDVVADEEKGKKADESSSLFYRLASDLPVSDANNVEASSEIIGSVKKEPDAADPSVPISSGGGESGVPEVVEIPRSAEADQLSTSLTHQTRASWINCCGLLDILKGSNQ